MSAGFRPAILLEKKEFITLILIFVFIALMAFTLGIHLMRSDGHLISKSSGQIPQTLVKGAEEEFPSREELRQQIPDASTAAAEELQKTLATEVKKSAIKLDQPRPVHLPDRSAPAPAPGEEAGIGKKAIVGSAQSVTIIVEKYSSLSQAQKGLSDFESKGLSVSLCEMGRGGASLCSGQYGSRAEGEVAAKSLVSQGKIKSFRLLELTSE